jgi:thioredoxin-related protein
MLSRLLLIFSLTAVVVCAESEYPKLGADIYDTRANGTAQIATAVQKAGAEHKNVLLMFGANWCIWCHRLHKTLETNPDVAKVLNAHYELVLIDVNKRHGTARNADVDAKYGNPTKLGLPVLVVLDATGKQLTTQDSGALEDGKSAHDPAKVIAFLEKWKPTGI